MEEAHLLLPLPLSLITAIASKGYTTPTGQCIEYESQLPAVLYLWGCKGLYSESIVPLGKGRVVELSLADCPNISDVSSLGGVRKLHLGGCFRVIDVSPLKGVESLYLDWCTSVKDVSALKDVTHLSLWGCKGVEDVSALKDVAVLHMDKGSQHIPGFEKLGRLSGQKVILM